ncbi:MAG: hypothetical protein ACRDY3_04550 [Acidimicrobiales bacterium]
MLDVHFVILGAVLSLLGEAFYIRDTLAGRTRPNRVTWLLWGVAPMLAFAGEVKAGVGLRALMAFSVGLGPLLVFAASFVNRGAVWRISRLDWACGVLSVAGTVVWLTSRQGMVAIGAAIGADALAAVPTLRKSWREPESESANAYWGSLANAVITLLTVTAVTAAVVTFPLYIALVTGIEVSLVAGRIGPRLARRRQPDGSLTPAPAPSRAPGSSDR